MGQTATALVEVEEGWWCFRDLVAHRRLLAETFCSPPLNLPSLRKEHERFDSLGSGGGPAGGGSGSSVYTPPSARSVVPVVSVPSGGYQKDVLNQKQKQTLGEELANERNSSQLSTLVDVRPQLQSRTNISNGLQENVAEIHGLGGSVMLEKDRRQEDYFSGPLPLVRFNPRSDWADDERDTGLGLTDRGREHRFSKSEVYWDVDFDFPRPSILPQKIGHNLFDRRGERDNATGKISSSEVTKVDAYGRDLRMCTREGREGNSWRASSPLSKDGFSVQEAGNEINGIGIRPSTLNREVTKENKYISSPFREMLRMMLGGGILCMDKVGGSLGIIRWTLLAVEGLKWNSREYYGNEQYKDTEETLTRIFRIQIIIFFRCKGLPINDPILNFVREKHSFLKSEKPYLEDPFIKDFGTSGFDGRDPFSGGPVGLVKKKKDLLKQTDFHDPVRESFEAELERVQKMQEQERQRIMEEHERAMELARREEEERMRLAREQEERQRRLEEERLDALRRAEQERLESMRRAEEQRIAREEEKHRILLEDERRKQAAKQKLLELEERIAKRHAEEANSVNINSSGVTDEKMSGLVSEKCFQGGRCG
ncbi:hypothetical protein GH714_032169 [Hevea brasiliensis]|uniref:Uncharacterized protein n=1 Tax=Hevea brasiliensis TaxID=3981 RepID=A0A6A6L440_HEVBR|nr:hypothetical protein GH714_032169 [Hevea brasiliensis]